MKQLLLYMLAMAICFGLSACKEPAAREVSSPTIPIPETAAVVQTPSPEPTEVQVPAVTYTTALRAYEALWDGVGTFTDSQTKAQLDIHSLEELYSPAPVAVTEHSFSMVDLDQDGTEEMILWVNQEYEEYTLFYTPVILRYENGSLSGQVMSRDDFQDVKTDGSFLFWHPDEGYLGYANMRFSDGIWQRNILAEVRAGRAGEMIYSINGTTVTQEDYRALEREQDNKSNVTEYSSWYRYLEESTAQPRVPAATETALAAYGAVLRGEKDICRSASRESIPISKISLFFTVEELPWEVVRFAVQDLDGDGSPEAVLEISDYAGFVILRCFEDGIISGGEVVGSEVWYRSLQNLKADGSYMRSGNSSDHSYWKYQHNSGILLAECYESNGTMAYWVNGEKVDAEAFAAFEAEQAAKPDALWHESWEDFLKNTDLG